jgi:hypothetical protein
MLRRAALVRTDVSEEAIASIIRETRIGELGKMLETTRDRSMLRRNSTPHDVTCQKTAFLIVAAVKTSNLTYMSRLFFGLFD